MGTTRTTVSTTDKHRPKAYSYLRFSTPEQMQGDSFRRQTALAEEYALRNGLVLDNELTFQDLGVSAFRGRNVEEGMLGEFLKAVSMGVVEEGSYLLVESLDRMSRQYAFDASNVLGNICRMGITVVTLNDGKKYDIDSLRTDPMSFVYSILLFVRANEESETKSKRLKAVWENKRKNALSKPMTATAPSWLILEGGKFRVIKERGELVKRIYQMYLEGTGPLTIASEFNKEGLSPWGSQNGPVKYWHRSYIQKILDSPAVIGDYIVYSTEHISGRKVKKPQDNIKGYYPPVIDLETYTRVRELRESKGMRGRKAKVSLKNILSGLSVCPVCGDSMVFRDGIYLVCSKAKSGAGCNYKSVRYSNIEGPLLNMLPEIIASCPYDMETEEGELRKQLEQLLNNEAGITLELERLLVAVQTGRLDPSPTVNLRIRELELALDTNRFEQKQLQNKMESLDRTMIDVKLKGLIEAMTSEQLNKEQMNTMLRSLFSKVVVNYTTGHLEFNWRHSKEVTEGMYKFVG